MNKKFPNYKQYSKSTCGITCLKIIAKHYNKIIDVSVYNNRISKEGLSIYDLCNISEEIGLKSSTFEIGIDDINSFNEPLIIHWKNNHFVVLYKIYKNTFYISDPVKGLLKYSRKDFYNCWIKKSSEKGHAILLEPTEKFKTQKNSKSNYLAAVEFLGRHLSPYKRSLTQLVIVMMIISLIYASLPFITRSIIDIGIGTNDLNFITIILIANICLLIFKSFGEWIRASISLHIASRVKISIITDYLIKIFSLPINFIEGMLLGDIIQRSKDQEKIQQFVSNSAVSIVMSILILTTYSFILFFFNSILFYIFISCTIAYVFWVISFYQIRKKMDIKYYEALGRNQSSWIEILKNFEDIKLNNYSLNRRWKWEKIQGELYDTGIKLLNIERIQRLGADFINGLKDLGLTFYGAYLVLQGDISFGTLISIQFIIGQTSGPVSELINFIKQSQAAFISFLRVNDIIKEEEEQNKLVPFVHNLSIKKNDITLRNVSYQYKANNKLTLKNINLTIKGGEITAIVGASGSGKTTLLKLISKIDTSYKGDIFIGDTNIKNFDNSFLRSKLGIVFQDSNLYKESILNNIVMSDENNYSIDFLNRILDLTCLRETIKELERGIFSELKEGGKGLSHGQKQRILLARAIYKKPNIFLLDEFTSALDSITEKKILNSLTKRLGVKTSIIVSHKLSTIKSANKIIVLNNGFVVEEGSLEVLIDRKQYFYNLFKEQLKNNDYE